MAVAQLNRAQDNQRILERRALRAQRSSRLGRWTFYLTGMGLLLVVRLNPELLEQTAVFVQGMQTETTVAAGAPEQSLGQVGTMPRDKVPVHRGGFTSLQTN